MFIFEARRPLFALLALLVLSTAAQSALAQDSDGDGLLDTDETGIHGTLPLNPDTDGDGLPDGAEVNTYGTNPLSADTDGDGLTDFVEVWILSGFGLDPNNPDSDGNGTPDGDNDYDADGLTIAQELYITSNNSLGELPTSDFDLDGLSNGDELFLHATDPRIQDTDADRLTDADELNVYLTNPLSPDSDGDGVNDGDEVEVCLTDPATPDVHSECLCEALTMQVHLLIDPALVLRMGTVGAEDFARASFAFSSASWNTPGALGGPGIRTELAELTVFEQLPAPWGSDFDPITLLSNVAAWSQSDLPVDPPVRDAVLLLTGNGLLSGSGLSYVGAVSRPLGVGHVAASLCPIETGSRMAHQLGHIMGADHDASDNPCDLYGSVMSVMSGGLGISTFSTCSINYFQNTLSLPGITEALTPDCTGPECPADTNGDGILDNGDIGAFVGLFLSGDLAADFNGDGILDNGDIGAFVQAFLAGC